VNHERIAVHQKRSHDDLRCADQLSNPNDGGVGQDGSWRDLKAFERLLPFRPCDRAGAERVEVVGQQHGRGLGEPE
jgi:hypothetical protein